MFRLVCSAAAVVLLFAGVANASDFNKAASAQAASDWGRDAAALAPSVPESQAVSPTGPTLIASRPIPDTRANRARYGQPLSRSGRRTPAIGD